MNVCGYSVKGSHGRGKSSGSLRRKSFPQRMSEVYDAIVINIQKRVSWRLEKSSTRYVRSVMIWYSLYSGWPSSIDDQTKWGVKANWTKSSAGTTMKVLRWETQRKEKRYICRVKCWGGTIFLVMTESNTRKGIVQSKDIMSSSLRSVERTS